MQTPLKKLIAPVLCYFGERKLNRLDAHLTKPPILIGGCARSGTTLLLAILSAHPDIYAFPEELGVFDSWEQTGYDHKGGDEYVPKRLDRFYRTILLTSFPEHVSRWCEKTPANVLHFDKILEYFNGDVRLIHLIRDGRDVVTSVHPSDPDSYWVPPERWIRDVSAGLDYSDHPKVTTVKYRALVMDYEETIAELTAFLGEEFHRNLQHWEEHTAVKGRRAWFHGARSIHGKSIGRWEQPEHADRIEQVMQNERFVQLMAEQGYLEK